MRRKIVVATLLGAVLGLSGTSGVAVAQEPEPDFGICLRPALFKLIDLPGLNIPAERVPWESLEVSIGGQYRNCKT